jgi:hypothetical protein
MIKRYLVITVSVAYEEDTREGHVVASLVGRCMCVLKCKIHMIRRDRECKVVDFLICLAIDVLHILDVKCEI